MARHPLSALLHTFATLPAQELTFFVEDSAKALQHITNAHFLGANAMYLSILLCKRCCTQFSDLVAQIVS